MVKKVVLCEVKVLNKVNSVGRNVNFKSRYAIKGKTGMLDEICWVLKKKRDASKGAFDFLDLRLAQRPPETNVSLTPSKVYLIDEDGRSKITMCKLDSSVLFKPTEEPVDLFVTGTNNVAVKEESKIDDIMYQTFKSDFGEINSDDKLILLIDKKEKINSDMIKGNPIISLKKAVIETILPIKQTILNAEKVLQNIQKGTFDVEKGLCLDA